MRADLLKELPFEKDEFDVLVSTAVTTYLSKYFFRWQLALCETLRDRILLMAVYEVEVAFIASIHKRQPAKKAHVTQTDSQTLQEM